MERQKGGIGRTVLGERWGAERTELMGKLSTVIPLCLSVSAWLRSHGAAFHHSASVVSLLSSLCSDITFIKIFWGGSDLPQTRIKNPPYDI